MQHLGALDKSVRHLQNQLTEERLNVRQSERAVTQVAAKLQARMPDIPGMHAAMVQKHYVQLLVLSTIIFA